MNLKAAVIFVLAACVLAACGGDSEDSGGSDDFLAEADSICRSGVEQQIEIEPPPADASPEEIAADLRERIELRAGVVQELQDLEPPSDVADEFEEALAAREDTIAVLEREVELAEEGVLTDEPSYQKVLSDFDAAVESAEAAAAEVGLTDCANKLSPEVEEEIKTIVETFEVEPLEDCTEYATDRLIEDLFGGLEECQEAQNKPPPEGFTESVTFEDVGGQEGLSAYAIAELEGGAGDGQRVEFSLVYEDDTYKLDGVFLAAE